MSSKTTTIALGRAPEGSARDLGDLFNGQTLTDTLSLFAEIQRLISIGRHALARVLMDSFDFQRDRLLLQTWPEFLSLMDSDQEKANRLLAEYLYRFFTISIPPMIRSSAGDRLMDFVHDFYIACTEKNYARLRHYTDEGKPFSAWLFLVSRRFASDWVRLRRNVDLDPLPVPEEDEGSIDAWEAIVSKQLPPRANEADRLIWKELLDITVSYIKTLPQRQQLLLVLSAEGYDPRDMVSLLGEPPDRNKAVSDDLRYARTKLMNLVEDHLRKRNLKLSDYFGG